MALAEPALRQFGLRKLQGFRIRGGSLLGSAIGTGVGIGSYLAQNYDFTWPWSPMLQPGRRQAVIGSIPTNGSTNQYQQTLRLANKRYSRKRSSTKQRHRGCCCCSC